MLLRAIIFKHVIVKKGRPAVTASIIVIVTVYVAVPVPSSSPLLSLCLSVSLSPWSSSARPTFAPLTGPPPAFFDFISVKKGTNESRNGLVRRKTCEKQGSTGGRKGEGWGISCGDILAASSTSLFYCAHFSFRLFSSHIDTRNYITVL